MRIAFGIVSLFQGGGLQRDCAALARAVRDRGHDVTIFTAQRERGFAPDLEIIVLKARALTNHGRNLAFARAFRAATAGKFDALVGFDQLLGLDILYCPHRSAAFLVRRRSYLRFNPRYRALIALERASFQPGSGVRIMLLSPLQVREYREAWNTEPSRLIELPPTVSIARCRPEYRAGGVRADVRRSLGLDDWTWLAICAQPETKGLDRTIEALAEFPAARLLVAGLRVDDGKVRRFRRLAQRLGVAPRIQWLGFRDDVPELMAGAELLVHPARADTTGTVILEAVVNGLPVVTTAACGYAVHVETARAGIVIPEPFSRTDFAAALAAAQDPELRRRWSSAGADYGTDDRLFQALPIAADIILGQDRLDGGREIATVQAPAAQRPQGES